MENFYSYNLDNPFKMFSTSHYGVLLTILAMGVFLYFAGKRCQRPLYSNYVRYFFALVIIVQEIFYFHWRFIHDNFNWRTDMPLELCGASLFLSAVMLITNNYRVYEIVYFFGLAGATQALLTPALKFDFPHFRFLQFFLSHGLIIISVIYMTFIEKYRPTMASYKRASVAITLYAAFISVTNYLLGANYMFLCDKPGTASVLDLFGPWPYYLGFLIPITFVMFFVVYLPYFIKDRFKSL